MKMIVCDGSPAATFKEVEAGRLPARGQGPTAAESRGTAFRDVAVAHAGKSTVDGRGAGAAAHCVCAAKAGPASQGCGYVGSAYCILACGMAALKNPPTPGAGLTPLVALDSVDLRDRLAAVGYEFEAKDGLPPDDVGGPCFRMMKEGNLLKATGK